MQFDEWCNRWHIPPAAIAELVAMQPVASDASVPHSENHVQAQIRLAAAAAGVRLWRNNSGACRDDTGRMIRYGLGNDSARINDTFKSSDLIGLTASGVFVAIECKRPDWRFTPGDKRAQAQSNFLATVAASGGKAGFARSVDEFYAIVR